MTEKVYDSLCVLILKFGDHDNQEQNFKFAHDALQEMRFAFQKATF